MPRTRESIFGIVVAHPTFIRTCPRLIIVVRRVNLVTPHEEAEQHHAFAQACDSGMRRCPVRGYYKYSDEGDIQWSEFGPSYRMYVRTYVCMHMCISLHAGLQIDRLLPPLYNRQTDEDTNSGNPPDRAVRVQRAPSSSPYPSVTGEQRGARYLWGSTLRRRNSYRRGEARTGGGCGNAKQGEAKRNQGRARSCKAHFKAGDSTGKR